MPPPAPSKPVDRYPVTAAPCSDGSAIAVRLIPPLLWLSSAAGPARDARIVLRAADGKPLASVPLSKGASSAVDLRLLASDAEHEIAHEREEALLAPKLRLRTGELRACLDRGDAAGAVAALQLVWPEDEPKGAPGKGT